MPIDSKHFESRGNDSMGTDCLSDWFFPSPTTNCRKGTNLLFAFLVAHEVETIQISSIRLTCETLMSCWCWISVRTNCPTSWRPFSVATFFRPRLFFLFSFFVYKFTRLQIYSKALYINNLCGLFKNVLTRQICLFGNKTIRNTFIINNWLFLFLVQVSSW